MLGWDRLRNQVHPNDGWDMKQLRLRYFSERLEVDKDYSKLDKWLQHRLAWGCWWIQLRDPAPTNILMILHNYITVSTFCLRFAVMGNVTSFSCLLCCMVCKVSGYKRSGVFYSLSLQTPCNPPPPRLWQTNFDKLISMFCSRFPKIWIENIQKGFVAYVLNIFRRLTLKFCQSFVV